MSPISPREDIAKPITNLVLVLLQSKYFRMKAGEMFSDTKQLTFGPSNRQDLPPFVV